MNPPSPSSAATVPPASSNSHPRPRLLSAILMNLLSQLLGVVWGFFRALLLVFWSDRGYQLEIPENYEAWYMGQYELDAINGADTWIVKDRNSSYDWQILRSLRRDLEHCRRMGDDRELCSQLRAQSSRNVCRILSPALYRKSPIQTKRLIHEYIKEVRQCIAHLADRENISNGATSSIVSAQEKRQVLHDMRRSLGRTSLVLQGGAMVSMCNLGVVKALYLQHLLPQIITGTSTGAMIAALVCATPNEELLDLLGGTDINIDSFIRAKSRRSEAVLPTWLGSTFLATLIRRYRRYRSTHHFFDIEVLGECCRDNLGDLTFEEAYALTGRILNITIAMSDVAGTPQLLNYITTPHVLIWSAVVASIATSKAMYAPVRLLCKSDTGEITFYFASDSSEKGVKRQAVVHPEAPLTRLGELFNVNHFIVSQTRPYIAPFIQLQRAANYHQPLGVLVGVVFDELLHWLEVMKQFGLLPTFLQRVLIDEVVPSFAGWSKISITPQIGLWDVFGLFDYPTKAKLETWSARGEKCTWPFICELRCRTEIELELNAAYASMRRRGILPMTDD